MDVFIHMGEPFFDQNRLVRVNCLLETMKDHKAFAELPAGAIEKLHGYYQQYNTPSDPELFQKQWDATVDKGWPTVELIGIRTPSEAKHWQKVVAMGGEDVGAIPELQGNVGLIHHPAMEFGGEFRYEGFPAEWIRPPWTSREKRKRGRPAKRKVVK